MPEMDKKRFIIIITRKRTLSTKWGRGTPDPLLSDWKNKTFQLTTYYELKKLFLNVKINQRSLTLDEVRVDGFYPTQA